jgi:hypothetical protein
VSHIDLLYRSHIDIGSYLVTLFNGKRAQLELNAARTQQAGGIAAVTVARRANLQERLERTRQARGGLATCT